MLAKGGGLSPRREARTSRRSRQCVCIPWHWFGEVSGEWPQVQGEECVPSKSQSFLPLQKLSLEVSVEKLQSEQL